VLDCNRVMGHGPAIPGSALSLYVHNHPH
jgi:hypothetical protein